MDTRALQRAQGGHQVQVPEPQTALSKRDRDHDAFACVASFWLGPRGYDAAPAPRPRLAMPSIELESSSTA